MRDVLRQLSSHGISLQVDFYAHSFDMVVQGSASSIFDPARLAMDFFRAVAVSGVKAEVMIFAPSEHQHLENIPDGFGRVLAPAFSTLKEVSLGCGQHGVSCGSPGEGSGGLSIAKQICASADRLQVLQISLALFDAGPRHCRILEEMVLSNHSSVLKRLVIEDALLEMDSLRKVITHVKPTLSHLTLSRVMLTPFWREGKAVTFLEVYQMLTKVPGLREVLLGKLIQSVGGAQDNDVKFRTWLKWTRENRPADGRDLVGLIGRNKVKLGLEKLIQKQLTNGHLLSMFA